MTLYNRDFGILPSATVSLTENFQKAIDFLYLRGGGTLVIERGIYLVESLRIRSNVTLYLKSGCVILGSNRFDKYRTFSDDKVDKISKNEMKKFELVASLYYDSKDENAGKDDFNKSIFKIISAKNASIVGEGGSYIEGTELDEENTEKPNGIYVYNSQFVTLKGFSIKNTVKNGALVIKNKSVGIQNVNFEGCDEGVRLVNDENVKINSCQIKCLECCISGILNKNIFIDNCTINTSNYAINIDGSNVFIENIHAYGPGEYDKSLYEHTTKQKCMKCFFKYRDSKKIFLKKTSENIYLRHINGSNIDDFVDLTFDEENEKLLKRGIGDISLENINIFNLNKPLSFISSAKPEILIEMNECNFSFLKEETEFIIIKNCKTIKLENVRFNNEKDFVITNLGNVKKIELDGKNVTKNTARVVLREEK